MVPLSQRDKDGKGSKDLPALTLSGQIVDYTLDITSNEKHFPKRYRWCVTNRIIEKALTIDDYLILANSVRVRIKEDYLRRYTFTAKALEITYALQRDIDRAYRRFGINSFNIEHWTKLIGQLQGKIRNWIKDDSERYKNIG